MAGESGAPRTGQLLDLDSPKGWSTSLFGCAQDASSFALAACHPAVLFALTESRAFPREGTCLSFYLRLWGVSLAAVALTLLIVILASPSILSAPGDVESLPQQINAVPIALIGGLAFAAFLAHRRTVLREKHGIAGTLRRDLCITCCCTPCALAQQARHVADEERSPLVMAVSIEPAPVEAAREAAAGPTLDDGGVAMQGASAV